MRSHFCPIWANIMQQFKWLAFYATVAISLPLTYYFLPISQADLLQGLSLLEARAQADVAATALLFFLTTAALAYFAFPSMPLVYIAAGYYLDSLYGGMIVLLGSACGGLGAFLLYRKHIPQRFRLASDEHSPFKMWLSLLGLRLSPIVPAPLVNFFAALANVSALQYITTNLIGSAPLILFYVTLGRQGHSYSSGQPLHWWQFSGYLVILAVSTLLSALGPWRSFLKTIKRLKDEVLTSIRQSARADRTPPKTVGQVSD
jgi:uncharacterized membrane protein YdjX (TVP38/TMEM64 family)